MGICVWHGQHRWRNMGQGLTLHFWEYYLLMLMLIRGFGTGSCLVDRAYGRSLRL
jgi:hypothetical protein